MKLIISQSLDEHDQRLFSNLLHQNVSFIEKTQIRFTRAFQTPIHVHELIFTGFIELYTV